MPHTEIKPEQDHTQTGSTDSVQLEGLCVDSPKVG